jgi:hypothetical protein
MDPSAINWLAVVAAALATFLVGGLWYSPVLFARPWQSAVPLTDDGVKSGNQARIFGLSFLAALIGAVNLGFFLSGPDTTLAFGALAGALVGFGWLATGLATTYLFERRPLRLWLIDAGYHAVTFTLMGAIIGGWR